MRGASPRGTRLGTWLTGQEAQAYLALPDITTLAGLRNRALLAMLVNGGLRRSELAQLDVAQLQIRDSRWIVTDIRGKANRLRSVPIQWLVKDWIGAWRTGAAISAGPLFRGLYKGGHLRSTSLSPEGVWWIVTRYARALGVALAPYDLRRTRAMLMFRQGGDLKQIQLLLGHASVKTIETYLHVALWASRWNRTPPFDRHVPESDPAPPEYALLDFTAKRRSTH